MNEFRLIHKIYSIFFFLMRRKNGKIFYRRCTGLSQDASRHTCENQKIPSLEPMKHPRDHLSPLNFTDGWFQLKVAYDSSVIRSPDTFILGHTRARCTDKPHQPGEYYKKYPPPNDADSRSRPRCKTAGAGPDAISTGEPRCFDLDAHRALSSSSQVWQITRWASRTAQTGNPGNPRRSNQGYKQGCRPYLMHPETKKSSQTICTAH